MFRSLTLVVGLLILPVVASGSFADEDWTEVGVAKVDITPTHPVLLAGYGSRDREHEGVDEPIWARAIAIGEREPVVLVAVDNCGVPAAVTEAVARALLDQQEIARERIVVCSTHTHNAPTLSGYAPVLWGDRATPNQVEHVDRYTQWLTGKIVEVAQAALRDRRSAQLSWTQGRVAFGGNRRVLQNGKWVGFGFQTDGPVDHSLPALVARDRDDRVIAIWTNYACHCTTVGARNFVGGDWAGFANQSIEQAFPQALALTTIGCGADVGPQPSGNLELARQHGAAVAAEIQRRLDQPMKALPATIAAKLRPIRLPLGDSPSREHFQRLAELQNFDGTHARLMLKILDRDHQLPTHVDYPIGCWTFGSDLAIVFLAGEVVVDYAVRLKTELDWQRLWINGWSNDVPGYIPSRRILDEGGYEADFSQIYYGHPTRFAGEVENLIVATVTDMLGSAFEKPIEQPAPTFLRLPSGRERFAARVKRWAASLEPSAREQLQTVVALAPRSQGGFSRLLATDGGEDSWFNYSGVKERRFFVRQLESGATLSWSTPPVKLLPGDDRQVLVFLGGTGWVSEPETAGFVLLVDGQEALEFDVSIQPATWQSDDGAIRLHYLPTWTSEVDSGGFFYLEIPANRLTAEKSCTLAVRSAGEGSRRWFAIDPIGDVAELQAELAGAAKVPGNESP